MLLQIFRTLAVAEVTKRFTILPVGLVVVQRRDHGGNCVGFRNHVLVSECQSSPLRISSKVDGIDTQSLADEANIGGIRLVRSRWGSPSCVDSRSFRTDAPVRAIFDFQPIDDVGQCDAFGFGDAARPQVGNAGHAIEYRRIRVTIHDPA